MKLTVKIQSIEKINSQALIIGLFEKTKTTRSESKVEGLDQSISDMVSVDGFKAGLGEVTRVLRPMGMSARELILLGLGHRKSLTKMRSHAPHGLRWPPPELNLFQFYCPIGV